MRTADLRLALHGYKIRIFIYERNSLVVLAWFDFLIEKCLPFQKISTLRTFGGDVKKKSISNLGKYVYLCRKTFQHLQNVLRCARFGAM